MTTKNQLTNAKFAQLMKLVRANFCWDRPHGRHHYLHTDAGTTLQPKEWAVWASLTLDFPVTKSNVMGCILQRGTRPRGAIAPATSSMKPMPTPRAATDDPTLMRMVAERIAEKLADRLAARLGL